MPNMECLVGQLIAGMEAIKDDVQDIKKEQDTNVIDVKAMVAELKNEMKIAHKPIEEFIALKNKGIGIGITFGLFFMCLGWFFGSK